MVLSRFVFEPWQMPHALGKCIIRAKAQNVPKVPERTDLYWDADSKERSLDHRCQHGTAALAVACPFCGTKEKGWQDGTQTTLLTMDGPSITESPLARFFRVEDANRLGVCRDAHGFSQALPLGIRSATCVGGIR